MKHSQQQGLQNNTWANYDNGNKGKIQKLVYDKKVKVVTYLVQQSLFQSLPCEDYPSHSWIYLHHQPWLQIAYISLQSYQTIWKLEKWRPTHIAYLNKLPPTITSWIIRNNPTSPKYLTYDIIFNRNHYGLTTKWQMIECIR